LAEVVGNNGLAEVLDETPVVTIKVGGRDVPLRPMTLAQVAQALLVLDRLADKGALELDGAKDFNAVKMFTRGGEDAIELLHIAAGADYDFVARLDFVAGAKLLGKVYEVNKDFFDRNRAELEGALGPLLGDVRVLLGAVVGKAAAMLAELVLKAGLMRSAPSSPAGTASTQSADTPSGS
jgi:hypothetical protein